MLRDLNSTYLTLIPKCEGADKLTQFRPISLCNVIYKIISKLIVDRLKKWLTVLISKEQSGFVAGRKILDGVVRWSFLWKVLGAFGFGEDWIQWVMSCVTSASFFVLINGEHSELFGAS